MALESEEILVPSYDEILDMNNHFPEMNKFISKKEKQYIQICSSIDASDLPDNEKKIKKNTYYIYLMTVKKLLSSKNYKCSLAVAGTEYNEITINGSIYKGEYDFLLFHSLISKNDLIIDTYYGDGFLSIDLLIKTHKRIQS